MPPKGKGKMKERNKRKKNWKNRNKRKYRQYVTKSIDTYGHLRYAGPFPLSMNSKMNFSYTWVASANGSVTGYTGSEQIFRLNSCNDPLFATGGNYSLARNQLNAIYAKYKIHGALVEIHFTDPSTDGNFCCYQITGSNDITSLAAQADNVLMEKPNVYYKNLNITGTQVTSFKKYFSIRDIEGMTKAQWDADYLNYNANANADPLNVCFLRVALANYNSTTASCRVQVSITQYSTWYNPRTLPQST